MENDNKPRIWIERKEPDEAFIEVNHMAIIQIINNWTIEKIDRNNYRGHPMEQALWKQQKQLIDYLKMLLIRNEVLDKIIEKNNLPATDENDMWHQLNAIDIEIKKLNGSEQR